MTDRRLFLLACGAGLVDAATSRAGAAPGRAKAMVKVSPAKARYQDHPQDVRSCASCTLFIPPTGCKAVTGKVSPDGFCVLFELAD